jgi:Fic family protein
MINYKVFQDLIKTLDKYPTPTDLVYKYKFNHHELKGIYKNKLSDERFIKLELKSENSNPLIYLDSDYLANKLDDAENLLVGLNSSNLWDISDEDLVNGFVFSEIESSLAIEGVRSTRAKIEKISKLTYQELTTDNERVVKNMIEAYNYVQDKDITIDNIYTLYNILSKDCLKEDEKLKSDNYYRHDGVNIVGNNERVVDTGVDYKYLEKGMNNLLTYINSPKTKTEQIFTPHIIHYYTIYLHPYFDFNGRMARVLSHWYSTRYAPYLSLLFISEAINNKNNKHKYYNAITYSRQTNNDITFFIEYIADIIIEYSIIYTNYYLIYDQLEGNGNSIPRALQVTLKNVLAMPVVGDGFFNWKKYAAFSNDDYSKVLYLKHLNQLVNLDVLKVKKQKNANQYIINKKKWDLY